LAVPRTTTSHSTRKIWGRESLFMLCAMSPIRIRGGVGGEPFEARVMLDRPEAVIRTEGTVDWVVANAGGYGFYRSLYQPSLLAALVARLEELDPLERFTMVDDAWAFVESGQVAAASFMMLASSFADEDEQAVWGALLGGAAGIGHHLVSDEVRPRFERWVSDLGAPVLDRLGWEPPDGESDLVRRLRGRVITALGCLANDPETVQRARSTWERLLAEPTAVDPEVGTACIFVCAAHGDASAYRAFLARHKDAANPQEAMKYLRALASIDDPEAVDRTFGLMGDGTIRNQDTTWVLARMLANRLSGHHAWARLTKKWPGMSADLPPMTHSRMLEGLPALSDPDVALEIDAFFAENPLPHAAKALEQKLERLRAMVMMRERESGPVAEALTA